MARGRSTQWREIVMDSTDPATDFETVTVVSTFTSSRQVHRANVGPITLALSR
jgi:hypothetical protein